MPWNYYQVCKEMGWTYDELMSTPVWFVEHCIAFMVEESKAMKATQGG